MYEKLDLVAIGECLIELSANTKMSEAECLYKYYGGDTLAAAIAALRMGGKVGFITRVGNDSFKDYLLDGWHSEGLDISQVKISNEKNGLYIIARPSCQEKEIAVYRKKIAPSKLSIEDIDEEYIKNARIVYASGVTQSLSPSASEAVEYAFKLAKEHGVKTAYDPNYHSALTTSEEAKDAFFRISSYIDILFLNTKLDSVNILEVDSQENIIKRLWDRDIYCCFKICGEKRLFYRL